jgi:hypothetical protein
MAAAQYHYMIDCYYPDNRKSGGFRCDSRVIKGVEGEDKAISEAKLYFTWNNPEWFEIRRVTKKGSELIYNSKTPDQRFFPKR